MSGRVIRLLERTLYDLSQVAANTVSKELALATDVDISGARETTLLIRVHTLSITGGTGTIGKFSIVSRACAPTEEDPAQFFRDPAASPLITTDITVAATPAPALVRSAIPNNAGGWITVFLTATQYTTTAGTMQVTLSIDAALKD